MNHATDLLETWQINHRINLFLLENLETDWLAAKLAGGGRTIGEQWVHLNNVRFMWLQSGAPALADGLKVEKTAGLDKTSIADFLEKTTAATAKMLEMAFADGRLKGFKPHPTAFVGYLLAHEAHHRGQIMAIIRDNGFKISKKVNFGLWEWGTR